ncbi:MAG: ABC transporter permease [Candidatus Marinimicrobia bacterium]|nr:ABC transporter permease [Candidatus Neomarinimicrobiota bacterium]
MINRPFMTLIQREVWRFLGLYKQTLIPSVISSGLYIIVFGESLGSRIGSIKGIEYIHYIIPGLVLMNAINNAYQNSSSSIMQAKFLKFIDDLLITPLNGLELSIGYMIGGIIRGVMSGILVISLAWLLADVMIVNIPLTILNLILISWAFSALGVIVGIYGQTWDHIAVFTNFIFMPLTFLGGVFYSIDMLPEFWRNISLVNPLYWMINGMRYSMLGVHDSPPFLSIIISGMFVIVFSSIATLMFTKGYKIKE